MKEAAGAAVAEARLRLVGRRRKVDLTLWLRLVGWQVNLRVGQLVGCRLVVGFSQNLIDRLAGRLVCWQMQASWLVGAAVAAHAGARGWAGLVQTIVLTG
jgi:hypothetical protein